MIGDGTGPRPSGEWSSVTYATSHERRSSRMAQVNTTTRTEQTAIGIRVDRALEWEATQEREGGEMTEMHFPTAPKVAAAVRAALRENNVEAADRLITEMFGRVINASGEIPAGVFAEPESTGDERYDTLMAVGLAYALGTHGLPAAAWMEAVPALTYEWVWDQDPDPLPEYREYIRRQTPPMFLAKGLLLRDRDLRIL